MKDLQAKFEREIQLLHQEKGHKAVEMAFLTFIKVLFWLRQYGHGDIIISAVNHVFGAKIKTNTIHSIK